MAESGTETHTSAALTSSNDDRSIAVIASTMRSGSTLVKALLAAAGDVSDLQETNFQQFQDGDARRRILDLDDSRVVVLKRPAWYHESARYPILPQVEDLRCVLLVRDVYETVQSLRKMTFRKAHPWLGPLANRWLVGYWTNVMRQLLALQTRPHAQLVRYEDLVMDPISTTASLFSLVGSQQAEGIDSYQKPTGYDWKWGKDDGGPRIKSLRVLPPEPHGYQDQGLLRAIASSATTLEVRRQLGYDDLPL